MCPLSAYCAEVSSIYAASLCIYSASYCNTAIVGLCSFLCGKPALMQGQTGLRSELQAWVYKGQGPLSKTNK